MVWENSIVTPPLLRLYIKHGRRIKFWGNDVAGARKYFFGVSQNLLLDKSYQEHEKTLGVYCGRRVRLKRNV